MKNFQRVIWIVLDGVGAGATPDAGEFGDVGANTLGNLARALQEKTGRTLQIPNLRKLGLANAVSMAGVNPLNAGEGIGAYGLARERSRGKDTTTGHWEMAGLTIERAFQTFENGFPESVVERWVRENHLPGVLGNCVASGTEIIARLGEEHLRTEKPILYTSADSVWQVAASEESFGLERLYAICESARKICDELGVSRVIARPFVGNPKEGRPFKRTYNRKDLSLLPPAKTYLDHWVARGVHTLGIGKISSIFADQGIVDNLHTEGNTDGLRVLIEQVSQKKNGLIFCNLIDTDMLYGHRRDVPGFANALEEIDEAIGKILPMLGNDDLLVLSADHGNDPTYRGTDHTREHSPVVVYTPRASTGGARSVGVLSSFSDFGATISEALLGREETMKLISQGKLAGTSFLEKAVS